MGPASTSVRPAVRIIPNVIVVEPRKAAGGPAIRPVNVVSTPQVVMHESCCVATISGKMFPGDRRLFQQKMAKEASIEGPTNEQDLHNDRNYKQTTCTKLTTNRIEIQRPTIQRSPDKNGRGGQYRGCCR